MEKITENISSFLTSHAQVFPYQQAVIAPTGRDFAGRPSYVHLTYQGLDELTSAAAAGFKKIGVSKGTRTVVMVTPGIEFYALTFALFKLGAIPVMADPGMGVKNLKKCIDEAEPHAFVGTAKAHFFQLGSGAGKKSICIRVHVGRDLFRGSISYKMLLDTGKEALPFTPSETKKEDTAAILFTSGSTGVPKGVVYSHLIFISQIEALKKTYCIEKGERDLPTFPLFGLFGPALGMTEIIPDMNPSKPAMVNPEKIVEAIQNFGVTNIFGSPALLNRVGRYGAERGITLPSLRRVISAGAPVSADVLRRFSQMLSPGIEIHTPYGATEALPVSTIASSKILSDTSVETGSGAGVCVGTPLSKDSVKIITIKDEVIEKWANSLELSGGSIGEVVVRGDVVTSGYFKRPGSTQLAKIYLNGSKDSFYHRMGDVGYIDGKGRLWFCGRKSHRVLTSKETLFSVQCEAIFNTHPKVYRTALVGVKRAGETLPVLCVELEKLEIKADTKKIREELLLTGSLHTCTKTIQTLLFHPAFPVDVRHNAKIFREKLAVWADKKI
ncbi:MAG: fatty acid CoA ligase family protein [Nitrospinota bacterium]